MSHTHTNLIYHGIFSTKCRRPLLDLQVIPELTKVVGGIIRKRGGKLLCLNGTQNHIHLLSIFHPDRSISSMFRDIKAISCDWIHENFESMRSFAWQRGYAAFTVSRSQSQRVERYVLRQQSHHRTKTFEQELIDFLDKHEIEYDRRYVFDSEFVGGS